MTIYEWLALASAEEADTLHKFNFERERGFGNPDLDDAHAAFETYLSSIDVSTSGLSANDILDAFSKKFDARVGGPPLPDLRYIGPPISLHSRQIFLKSLGLPPGYLLKLGIVQSEVTRVLHDISYMLRGGGRIRNAQVRKLQETVASVTKPRAVSLPPVSAGPALPGYSLTSRPPAAVGNEPWWFTSESELEAEEAKLPEKAPPLQRSGYVAGVRAALGLHNPSDSLRDSRIDDKLKYRLLLQVAAEPAAAAAGAWRQPAIFSQGFPHLFVSRARSADGGRTVRLLDRNCSHSSGCDCGQDGLKEGIVPAKVVLDDDSVEIRGIYLALYRDLRRFCPPPCNEIRAKRAA